MEFESKGKSEKKRGNKHRRLVPGIQKEPFLTNVILDKTERDEQMAKTEVPTKRPRETRGKCLIFSSKLSFK